MGEIFKKQKTGDFFPLKIQKTVSLEQYFGFNSITINVEHKQDGWKLINDETYPLEPGGVFKPKKCFILINLGG